MSWWERWRLTPVLLGSLFWATVALASGEWAFLLGMYQIPILIAVVIYEYIERRIQARKVRNWRTDWAIRNKKGK